MYITVKKTIVYSLLFFVVLLISPLQVGATSWYDNYGYRKPIEINNPNASVLTNYQIRLSLHEGNGTDSGTDIYLQNHARADFADIRFTKRDSGTALDYWIESISSGTAVVWVEVDSLYASANTTIYVYYGKSGVSSQSNAHATFPFFDYFDENGIGGWTASTENLNHSDEVGNQSQTVDTSVYVSSPNSAKLRTYASCLTGPFDGVKSLITASPGLSAGNYLVEFSLKIQITGFRWSTTAAQRSRVYIDGSEKYATELNCNGSNCTADGSWSNQSFALTNSTVNTIALIGDAYDCTDGNTYFDNVRIRNYVSNQPGVSTIGSQEDLSAQSSQSQSDTPAPRPYSCPDQAPSGAPDLFQIDTTKTTATMFFTPLLDTNKFYISFSTQPNAEQYGAEAVLSREGVQNYQVNYLSPGTTYYFKIRGQLGCMPGQWSNILKVKTPKNNYSGMSYFKSFPAISKAL